MREFDLPKNKELNMTTSTVFDFKIVLGTGQTEVKGQDKN
jgi:hypothetical protein